MSEHRQQQTTAEQYAAWTEAECARIEIVDGTVVVRPSASKRHNRLARLLANALDVAAGPDWNADTDFDVRLQDVPLNNRRPDVTLLACRAGRHRGTSRLHVRSRPGDQPLPRQ
ncbi:Uma2 family endonuclease [Actinoplanes sp. NPDC049548]|uniref:Uma2 family endonuclease n=1 Tax=Actinoplanes sp. NPDC049548 TaxID=3155152 RepID=UPI003420CCEB